jgi:hypothetical protein
MSRAVMQQALDALEAEAAIYMDNDPEDGPPEAMTDAIRILRAELAKPEPEPFGYFIESFRYFIESLGNDYYKHRLAQFADKYTNDLDVVPLYRREDL